MDPETSARTPTEAEIRDWCIAYLRNALDNPAVEIEAAVTFARLGLDSASSVYFIVELEDWLGLELSPELTFDHPTIDDLSRYLTGRLAEKGGA